MLRSGGRLAAFPMPLGSERTLGLAGPYGTPLIAELPAPAEPAGGVSCAKACPGRYKLPSMARTSAVIRDIWTSGNFNNEVSRRFPQPRRSTAPCDVRFVPIGDIIRSLRQRGPVAPGKGNVQSALHVCRSCRQRHVISLSLRQECSIPCHTPCNAPRRYHGAAAHRSGMGIGPWMAPTAPWQDSGTESRQRS